MPSSSYVYLGLRGEFDPDELAARIGMVPSKSLARHSRDPDRGIPRCSILRFAQIHASDDEAVVDVYSLAESACKKLSAHKDRLVEVVRAHDVEATFQVVLYFPVSEDASTPAIGFSGTVVNFLSELGASIDIDSYRE